MKELVCIECGTVTAKLSSGSSVRKGTVTYCLKCSGEEVDIEDSSQTDYRTATDTANLDMLKNMFGFK